jgi:hypothetical protein
MATHSSGYPHSVSCIFTPLLLCLTFIIAVYLESLFVTSLSTRQYSVHGFMLSMCVRTSCINSHGCLCSIFPIALYIQCPSPITLTMSPSFCISCFMCVLIPLLFICFDAPPVMMLNAHARATNRAIERINRNKLLGSTSVHVIKKHNATSTYSTGHCALFQIERCSKGNE